MDKLVNWVMVGIALVLMNVVVDLVSGWAGDNAEMKRMFLWTLSGVIIMTGAGAGGDGMVDKVLKGWFGYVMTAVMTTVAIEVYIIINMIIEGGFDIMEMVYAAGFIFISSMMYALFWTCVRGAVKD